jgi:hypothetical protein
MFKSNGILSAQMLFFLRNPDSGRVVQRPGRVGLPLKVTFLHYEKHSCIVYASYCAGRTKARAYVLWLNTTYVALGRVFDMLLAIIYSTYFIFV